MNRNNLILAIVIGILLIPILVGAESILKEPYKSYQLSCGVAGGQLIIPSTSDPKSFNPIVAQETSTTQITSYIFEGLTRTHPLTLEVLPGLAQRWDTSDGKTWIFHLRKGVKWSDGVDFKAKDVVFTFNKLIYNPKIPTSSRDIFTIEGKPMVVEQIDDHTVKFILPFKFAPFLRALSHDILPAHKYESLVQEERFSFALALDTKPQDIVGTGPFKLGQYLPGERIILNRNEFYYKKDACGMNLPYLDRIVFIILANSDTALLNFLEGEIDYYSVRPQDLGILGPKQRIANFTIYNAGPSFGSNFLVFNQNPDKSPSTKKYFVDPDKLKWFKNKEFRKAVSYAIDRNKIIELLMNGLGVPQYSPLSPANTYYHSNKVIKYSYNTEKAKETLSNIGFKDNDGDGILEDKIGKPLEIIFFTSANDNLRIQIATLIKKDLEAIGIKIHFLPLDFNNLVNKLTATFDWEMILIGLTGDIEPYFGKNVWSYKGNLHMWNPSQEAVSPYEIEIDSIFNESGRTINEAKRKILFSRWQEIASDQLPLIYTVIPYSIYAVRDRFGNLYPTVYGGAFSEIENVYIGDKR